MKRVLYFLVVFSMVVLTFGCESGPDPKEENKNNPEVGIDEEKDKESETVVEKNDAAEMRRLLKLYDEGSKAEWEEARKKLMDFPNAKYKKKAFDALCLMLFNRFRISGAIVTVQRAQKEFKKIGVKAVPYLLFFMSHAKLSDNIARRYCGEAIALIGKEAIPDIVKSLKGGGHQKYLYDLVVTLGDINHPEVLPILVETSKHSDYGMRSYAAESLGKVNSPKTIAPLLELLDDGDEFVQQKAVKALKEKKEILEGSGQLRKVDRELVNLKKESEPDSDLYREINKTLKVLRR